MFPEEFRQRILSQNYVDSESLLKALEEPSPVSIRVNISKWRKAPVNAEKVPWCSAGYYLSSRPSYTLDPLFHSGCYYPQEASGMFLEQSVRQSCESLYNIRVLDLCGAPGGKSLLLSDMIGPESLLVTNEVIRARAFILAETVTKWGCVNTVVTQSDPEAFGNLPGFFDIILVDAPCSGEGMFRTDVAVREWSSSNAAHCSDRQKRIVMDVWPSLRDNGILVYSTCTFNPSENEENIKWLTGKKEAECLRLNISQFKGITEIDFDGIYGYGFYPDKIRGEGFFISVIRKKGNEKNRQPKKIRGTELKPGKAETETAIRWTEFRTERLVKTGDNVIAMPCDSDTHINLLKNLKVIKTGTRIFSTKNADYIPSHGLALSAGLKKEAFPLKEITLKEAGAYLQRSGLALPDSLKGWNIVTYKEINLGFINNIGNRINNYYPVEWRIRMNIPESGLINIIKWEEDGKNTW